MSTLVNEEKKLLKELARGDEKAFEKIYEQYKNLVVKVCYQITGNIEDARDLTQKVFFKLSKKSSELADHPCLRGWLYTTAKNISRDHYRYLSRQQQKESALIESSNEPGFTDCEIMLQIEDEISQLPSEDSELILMHYYEGLTQKEIAERLDINPSTLRTRLQKARENLEKNLKLKGVSVVTVFLASLESKAGNLPEISLPAASETFKLINQTGGIFMKALTAIAACVAAVFLINYAIAEDKPDQAAKVVNAKPAEIKTLTKAHNEYGFKLLKELHKEGENVFISPTSISTAFGMLHNGTVDEIHKEFEEVFGWQNFNPNTFNSANKELMGSLVSQDKKSILEIANSIWIKDDFSVIPAFKTDNKIFFNSEVNTVPFNPQTVKRINNWAEQKTHGKIKEIIQRLDRLEVMILINAVYFKGTWTKAFDKSNTHERDFTLSDDSKVKVPLMYKKEKLEYQDNKDFQAVRLPFGKGDLAMTFILPKNSLSDFQKTMTDEKFQSLQNNFLSDEIKLFVPRFKIEYSKNLNDPLKNMGLKKSFNFSNGFAKINATKELAISKVIHKTFLEVKEEGAEAAAVTAIFVNESLSISPIMKIDRPFLCAITNVKTGNVIFVGTIYNPLK